MLRELDQVSVKQATGWGAIGVAPALSILAWLGRRDGRALAGFGFRGLCVRGVWVYGVRRGRSVVGCVVLMRLSACEKFQEFFINPVLARQEAYYVT